MFLSLPSSLSKSNENNVLGWGLKNKTNKKLVVNNSKVKFYCGPIEVTNIDLL